MWRHGRRVSKLKGPQSPSATQRASLFYGFLDQLSSMNPLLCEVAKSMVGWFADPNSASGHTGQICFLLYTTALQILKPAVMFP